MIMIVILMLDARRAYTLAELAQDISQWRVRIDIRRALVNQARRFLADVEKRYAIFERNAKRRGQQRPVDLGREASDDEES
jgi:hypothetical protein